MQSSLLLSDTKKFLDKYTKFMTKNIYISKEMNQKFLNDYQYLIDELEKNKYLYQEQDNYKNVFRIYHHDDELLKLHNEKYLKNSISDYSSFFENMYPREIMDKNRQMITISLEEQMISIEKKKYIPLIVSKIKFLHDYLHKDLLKIQVLVESDMDVVALKKELAIFELDEVSVIGLDEYGKSLINKNESVLDKDCFYQELLNYIIFNIFPDKKHFSKFYQLFSNYIYLNKDYKDFDTFKDYHYYMYKRMFLDKHLSLKKYIEQETRKRKGCLRTIDNTFVGSKEEVDIANFLYLNSIEYQYNKDKSYFICSSKNLHHVITFLDKDEIDVDCEIISLDKKGKFLEELVYELIKRQYGMEKRSDDEVFSMFRDTTIDSYFSEFITNILMPSILYYQEKHDFDGTIFKDGQINELKAIYEYYLDFKKKNSYLDDGDIHVRIQDSINKSKYDYYIVLDNISFNFEKSHFIVLKEYPNVDILKTNVRLFYEYKTYLNDSKCLAVPHSYLNLDEMFHLTGMFFKQNIEYFNQQMKNNKKNIYICFYDDSNKLKSSIYLIENIYDIISRNHDKKFSFCFQNIREMKKCLKEDYFVKVGHNVIQSQYGNICCYDILHVDKKCDNIVLPFIIRDMFHQGIIEKDEVYQVKSSLFMVLSKCREGVYLMCPLSRKNRYLEVFGGFPYVEFVDEFN